MIHIAAVTQLRHDLVGRAYYQRKRADWKKPMEAMRCLKRRISDAVYRQLVADADRADAKAHLDPKGAEFLAEKRWFCVGRDPSPAADRPLIWGFVRQEGIEPPTR